MMNLDPFQADQGLFIELGLIAVKQGDEASARLLFDIVEFLNPQGVMHTLGYGLIAIHKLELSEAETHFRAVLAQDPNNARAYAFLAFTNMLAVMQDQSDMHRLDRLKRGAECADKAIKLTEEPSTKALAQSVLDWEVELQRLETTK